MTRVVVIGANGFIGSRVVAAAALRGPVLPIIRGEAIEEQLDAGDVVVNCAINSRYRSQPYDPEVDIDIAVAEAAARRDARFIMLSSRKVYPAAVRWGAREDQPAFGDDCHYGRNKAETERRLERLLGERACILRLANVFGFEYGVGQPARPSFFGAMLHSLRTASEIRFDMHPDTRRDFVPVEAVAWGVVEAAYAGAAGVFNLGCGAAVSCGELARAIIAGYGRGRLRGGDRVQDEFYLDVSKWTARFGRPPGCENLRKISRELGERLRDA